MGKQAGKRESKAEREARLAKQKKDEEQARAKVVKETANARAQANGQKPAPKTDRIPKKKKRTGVALSSADESDSSKSDSAKDQREASDEDDTGLYPLRSPHPQPDLCVCL